MGGYYGGVAVVIFSLLLVSFISAEADSTSHDGTDLSLAKESVADIFRNNPHTVLVTVSGPDVALQCTKDASTNSFSC